MIVQGGRDFGSPATVHADGARYDPVNDSWTPTTAPDARESHSAVWTGSEVIAWGGYVNQADGTNTGWRYNPGTESYSPLAVDPSTPGARVSHSAIWTGSEMIVWGGISPTNSYVNSGGRYSPALDSWTPTGIDGSTPSVRASHTSVWTGGEMIIWGGSSNLGNMNTGSRYCVCSAATYYRDADGDGVGDSSLSLSSCTPPAGYVAVSGDCNDQDGSAWSRPGEATSLTFSDETTLQWSAPTEPGAASVSYDLLRSSSPSDFTTGEICLASRIPDPIMTDSEVPAAVGVAYYLARADNACPSGKGPLGSDSNGVPRIGGDCP